VPPSEEFVVMGETTEEQLRRKEAEYPNSVIVQMKKIDTVVSKVSEKEMKREEDSKRKLKC